MGFNFGKFRKAVSDLSAELATLRTEIEAAKRRREDLETLPLAKGCAIRALHAMVDAEAGEYLADLRRMLEPVVRRPLTDFCGPNLRPDLLAAPPTGNHMVKRPGRGVLAFMAAEIKEAIARAVESMEWPEEVGPPPAARRAEIEELDRKIAELEAREQNLLGQADAAGIILR